MDEVLELCRRVLCSEELAITAAAAAQDQHDAGAERALRLAAALAACRRQLTADAACHAASASGHAADHQRNAEPGANAAGPLRGQSLLQRSVARELAAANRRLGVRERELLALAELLGADHGEIAQALGIEPAAVAVALARARLALRAQRRGTNADDLCAEQERALTLLTRRQDHMALGDEDETWLIEHLRSCVACERAHAAMLEASACYRSWPPGPLDWSGDQ